MNKKNSQEHWDDIYTENCPDEVSWFQKEPVLSLEVLQIIYIGGGTPVLTDYLLKLGYSNVAVLDISKKVLSLHIPITFGMIEQFFFFC